MKNVVVPAMKAYLVARQVAELRFQVPTVQPPREVEVVNVVEILGAFVAGTKLGTLAHQGFLSVERGLSKDGKSLKALYYRHYNKGLTFTSMP